MKKKLNSIYGILANKNNKTSINNLPGTYSFFFINNCIFENRDENNCLVCQKCLEKLFSDCLILAIENRIKNCLFNNHLKIV